MKYDEKCKTSGGIEYTETRSTVVDEAYEKNGEDWRERGRGLAAFAESLVSSRGTIGNGQFCETGDPYVKFVLEGLLGEEERLASAFIKWITGYCDYCSGLCFEGEMAPSLREGVPLRIYWRRPPDFGVWADDKEEVHLYLRCRVLIGREPR